MLHDAIKTILNGVLPYFIKKGYNLASLKKNCKTWFSFQTGRLFFFVEKTGFSQP